MIYPPEMTKEEIEQFEYEINRIIDIEREEGQFWALNAELQLIANEEREMEQEYQDWAHDELERDYDEPYEPDYNDDWYDEQYELDADYA